MNINAEEIFPLSYAMKDCREYISGSSKWFSTYYCVMIDISFGLINVL